MKMISAHVTGFYRSSFHAYTTEVTVDGHRWRLGLRYSKFHEFYDQLTVQEKDFSAEFPPKGTLFFTPKPEERQEQLEAFMQQVLAYYRTKRHPVDVENLLYDLLKVPRHLRSSECELDDDVSTSTESVLDEPMHEPAAGEKNNLKEDEQKKTQVAEDKAAVALQEMAMEAATAEVAQPVSPVADETRSVELTGEEMIAVAPESAQSVDAVADEPCSVELTEDEMIAAAPESVQSVDLVADEPCSVELTEEETIAVAPESARFVDLVADEPRSVELTEEETIAAPPESAQSVDTVADEPCSVELTEEETITVAFESAQSIDSVADEPLCVELTEVAQSVLEATEVKLPALVEESEAANEMIEENIVSANNEVVQEEEADAASPLASSEQFVEETVPADQFVAEIEEAAKKDTVSKTHLANPTLEETDMVLPTEQSVIESIAHEYASVKPQAGDEQTVSEGTILEENMKQKELATSERTSSWIDAYLPKSLVMFFRHRCMKKTNLVVLCVALLLPMVLARR